MDSVHHTQNNHLQPWEITSMFMEATMKEAKATCKVCLQDKPKRFLKVGAKSTYIYTDDSGRQWHGRTCPQCHLDKKNAGYVKKNTTDNPGK